MLRSRIYVTLPLKRVGFPDQPCFMALATYYFDVGLQVGNEFQIQDWKLGENYSLSINATAGIVKRVLTVIPKEMDSQKIKTDVFQISLYAEIADKEKIDEICKAFISLNPGMFLED